MAELARGAKQIGSIIHRARKKLRWNQTMLGQRTGLRQETISRIETGSASVRLETVLTVLAALDLEFRIAPRTKARASDMEDLF